MLKMATEVIVLKRVFDVCIEQDEEDGLFVATVPGFEGCHTQAKTLNELRDRISEAVVLYLASMPDRLKLDMEYKKEE